MREKNKSKLVKILASAILVLTTNSLPSHALNEHPVAELPKETETQTSQTTNENRKPLIDKKTSPKPQPTIDLKPQPDPPPKGPGICRRRVWHQIQKKWVYIWVLCN